MAYSHSPKCHDQNENNDGDLNEAVAAHGRNKRTAATTAAALVVMAVAVFVALSTSVTAAASVCLLFWWSSSITTTSIKTRTIFYPLLAFTNSTTIHSKRTHTPNTHNNKTLKYKKSI